MPRKQTRQRQRRKVKIPSVYRYMALGLLLPILVFVGMLYGYGYGEIYGEFAAWAFAALGSIAGLVSATIIIVKVVLFWDRKVMNQVKAKGRKPYEAGKRRNPS